jgi:hypothetical protein
MSIPVPVPIHEAHPDPAPTGARNRAELTRYALQAGIEPVVPAP